MIELKPAILVREQQALSIGNEEAVVCERIACLIDAATNTDATHILADVSDRIWTRVQKRLQVLGYSISTQSSYHGPDRMRIDW